MSSIAASGDMAPRADVSASSVLLRSRVVSALLLGPLVLVVLYVGYPAFELLVAAAVAVMAFEWCRLCSGGAFGPSGYLFAATVVAGVGAAAAGLYGAAFAVVAAGAILVGVIAAAESGRITAWNAAGVVAVGLTGISLVWLRASPDGLAVAFWFVIAIWITDIAAFFAGRAIGGPRLAPSISPNKTWAGLAGGVAGAAIWSVLWALWTDGGQPGTLVLAGAGTAVLAQLGDLGESLVKRRFGAKDAGTLIPGHGGLLDRVDGIMGAAPIVALSIALAEGDMSRWA
jgi:phosphatidate cytidylyltransferase